MLQYIQRFTQRIPECRSHTFKKITIFEKLAVLVRNFFTLLTFSVGMFNVSYIKTHTCRINYLVTILGTKIT